MVPWRPLVPKLRRSLGGALVSALFELGRIVATPAALSVLAPEEPLVLLQRHQSGDWGDVPPADARENRLSVKRGFRVLSSYRVGPDGVKLWVLTEADRSSTTILLPSEY